MSTPYWMNKKYLFGLTLLVSYICPLMSAVPNENYSAVLALRNDSEHTLGNVIAWDEIVDDPHGDVVVFPYSGYIAPQTGYYVVSVQIDQLNIKGAKAIPGLPMTTIELYIYDS